MVRSRVPRVKVRTRLDASLAVGILLQHDALKAGEVKAPAADAKSGSSTTSAHPLAPV